jgi:hypothetical protein
MARSYAHAKGEVITVETEKRSSFTIPGSAAARTRWSLHRSASCHFGSCGALAQTNRLIAEKMALHSTYRNRARIFRLRSI